MVVPSRPIARRFHPVPALLLTLLLAACGGGGGGGGTPPAAGVDTENYLALVADSRWLYRTTYVDTDTVTYSDDHELASLQAGTLPDGTPALIRTLHYVQDDQVLLVENPPSSETLGIANGELRQHLTPGEGVPVSYLTMFRLPLRSGDSYTAHDVDGFIFTFFGDGDWDGDGLPELARLRRDVTVAGIETVTVPAGTFSALKVIVRNESEFIYSLDGHADLSSGTTTSWYAPDFGLVKERRVADNETFPVDITAELIGYRLDGTSTDTTPPSLAGTTPEHLGTVESTGAFVFTFSEVMDPSAFTLNVTHIETSAAVSVSRMVVGTRLRLFRESGWAPGTYEVVLTGGSDALGNALPTNHVLRFTVD
jgi:hypothetical protein